MSLSTCLKKGYFLSSASLNASINAASKKREEARAESVGSVNIYNSKLFTITMLLFRA